MMRIMMRCEALEVRERSESGLWEGWGWVEEEEKLLWCDLDTEGVNGADRQ